MKSSAVASLGGLTRQCQSGRELAAIRLRVKAELQPCADCSMSARNIQSGPLCA